MEGWHAAQPFLRFLAPRARRDAPVPELVEALEAAQAAYYDDTADPDLDGPLFDAYRTAMRLAAEALAAHGPDGAEALLGLLRDEPGWPLGMELAPAAWPLAPEETRGMLDALREDLEDEADAAAIERVLAIDDDDEAAQAFPLPADASFVLALHQLHEALEAGLAPAAARGAIADLLDEVGLADRKAALLALFAPAAGLRAKPGDGPIPLGASRLGGTPDLPPDLAWPTNAAGEPLALLVQLRLSDLDLAELPETGMLWAFYDATRQPWHVSEDQAAFQVLFHPSEDGLAPRPAGDAPVYAVVPVEAVIGLVPTRHPNVEAYGWTPDEAEWAKLMAIFDVVADAGPAYKHQVLGDVMPIQDGHPNEVHRGPWDQRYRLLLTIGSDALAGMGWADGGRLYFWLPQPALAKADFRGVLGFLQSH